MNFHFTKLEYCLDGGIFFTCAIDSGGSESLSSQIVSLASIDALITLIHVSQMKCDITKITGHLETRTYKSKN